MAFVIKFAKGVRNHWKKSTFAACLMAYGGSWLKEKYEIDDLMKFYCEEALKHGQQAINGTVNPRTVTVILNPAANKRKALEEFEKYCSPILNLAGICVDVVQTESEGHAKELVQNLQNTDAVIVAGGDGTLSEVVTGLLRRTGESNGNVIPVGVLPLGISNSVGSALFPGGSRLPKVKSMADASLAIVEEATKPIDVMKIELINEGPEPEEAKPVYALSGIEWGAYRDAAARKDKYWYYGPLRKYATYIFSGYKDSLSWNCNALVTYTLPCEGCSNCTIERTESDKRWYHRFFSSPKDNKSKAHIINDQCKLQQEKQISTTDLALITSNILGETSGPPQLQLHLGPDSVDYVDFVSAGFKTETGGNREVKETILARQMEIKPVTAEEGKEIWFSIDNEDFEVKPVKITLLPKIIRMFCKKSEAIF
ncbi:PREDICTED: acylglycerol kinase, mitochondrial [Nicrophorus vespilloides]|uniref:Acylglycerol kinase, mitochondrial n=1 Tax=Nicrophorus vespilloides TaxID=110193 RepID=A0ABM1MZD3_NICVS|nr:PREDICTED: acylglycerol kinase, mitochondrial [Nicrophorus vespilloides]